MDKITIGNHDIFYYDVDYDNVVSYLKRGYLYGEGNYRIGMMYLKNHDGFIIDCGAHIGTFSFSPVLDGKKVLIIEAAHKNIECLQQTFKNFPNAIVEHSVVLDTSTTCDFPSEVGPFGMVQMNGDGNKKSSTIDEICSKHNIDKISFIKCDIEGYELEALVGSKKILEKNKPLILLEINGHCLRLRNKKPFDILDTIEKLDYYAFFKDSDNSLIPVDKNSKFPFCVIDVICIHKDNIHQYIGEIILHKYLNNESINNIISHNIPRSNEDCKKYFETIQ